VFKKIETIEEFLARGGQIKVYPAVKPEEQEEYIRPTTTYNVQLMSLDEGAHFFSERREDKVVKKKTNVKNINVDALPDNIRRLLNI